MKNRSNKKIWQSISIILLFSSLIFMICEMDNLENTFEANIIWKKFGLVGIGLALLILFIIYKIQPAVFHESESKFSVIFSFVFGIPFLCISFVSIINREFSEKNIVLEKQMVTKKSVGGKRNGIHWFFIKYNDSEIRFKVSEQKWEKIEIGKEIELETQIGYLDYKFINKF